MVQGLSVFTRGFVTTLILLMGTMFTFQAHSSAGEETGAKEEHGKEKGFDAGKNIMGHVKDGHSIHFMTLNKGTEDESHISLPLPVILYSDKGLDLFMSSEFHHGHSTYKSESTGLEYALEGGDVKVVNADVQVYDLSITKNIFGMFLALFIMVVIFLSIAKAYKKRPGQAPKGLQSFMEPLILFIRDEVAKPNIGEHKYHRFLPFLLTIFFFIWISNLMGLIPFIGGFNITGNIGIIAVLAIFVMLITNFNGNKHYWQHIFAMPGIPWWLLPIMIPIELLQIISKPFILMVRLTANITAGHIIILSFVSLIMMFGQDSAVTGYSVSVGSVLFMIFMNMLELLIAFIQAYVFTLLSAIYFGSAVEEAH